MPAMQPLLCTMCVYKYYTCVCTCRYDIVLCFVFSVIFRVIALQAYHICQLSLCNNYYFNEQYIINSAIEQNVMTMT